MSVSLVYQVFRFATRISCFLCGKSFCSEIGNPENLKILHIVKRKTAIAAAVPVAIAAGLAVLWLDTTPVEASKLGSGAAVR